MGKKGKKKTPSSGSSSGRSSASIPSPSGSSSSAGNSTPSTASSTPGAESLTPPFVQRGGGDAQILSRSAFESETDFPMLQRGVSFQPVYHQQQPSWAPQPRNVGPTSRMQPQQPLQPVNRQHRQMGWQVNSKQPLIPHQLLNSQPQVTPLYMTELPSEGKKCFKTQSPDENSIKKIAPPQLPKPPLYDPIEYPVPKIQANITRTNELLKNISELHLSSSIPKRVEGRPVSQNRGKQIWVDTNHLKLDFAYKKAIVNHYDVVVEPEKPFKFYRPALEMVRRECYPKNYPSFDGKKNIYSFEKLPFKDDILVHKVIIHDEERGSDREMTVQIQWVNNVDLGSIFEYTKVGDSTRIPQEAIQAIDVVLRQPSAKNFCQVGRSYFTPPGQAIPLGDGLDLWYGFFQSAIIGWKPYLNVDVAHKGFPSPVNCVEAASKFMQTNRLEPNSYLDQYSHANFCSFMKGLKVEYNPPPGGTMKKRTFKVIDLGLPVKENIVDIIDKGKTSVWKYFLEVYNYNIQFVNLPTLQCGSASKPISIPLELCKIQEGQVVLKKMNEIQTRNMVRAAAVPAYDRKKKIEASIKTVSFNTDPYIQEFGLSVARDFTKVPARIIDAPILEYTEQKIQVSGGVWRSGKFIKPSTLDHWCIYSVDNRVNDRNLKELAYKLMEVSKEVGMVIKEPRVCKIMSNCRELERDLSNFSEAQIVFVVLSERGPVTYAKVKQTAELRVGVLTQCIKSRTLMKLNNSTVGNILLKLNAKLNGINHSIAAASGNWPSFFNRAVMVVGADVTHPSPDQVNVPSIAAVAASHDLRAFRYNMIYRIQPPKEEIIRDLENIIKEQLMIFYKRTGYKPLEILFYRDGVSEGQFKKVISEEVMAIKRACKKLSRDYEPAVTFFVVQKRHHTRFFPKPGDADGRNKNVPAGTVVDTEIVHPTELDFYLVSHASIQGTSRPTKYHLLCNDSNMSQDDLEEITYYLCHLFTRCTRSVSYPAPTYYAHLAAFRVRSYIDMSGINLSNLQHEQKKREIKPAFVHNSPMFFV